MGRQRAAVALPATPEHKDPRFVEALARGFAVLRAFRPDDRWLTHKEMVARTGLAPATVSRLSFTLVSLGYLKHQPQAGAYALDLAVLGLGFSVLGNFDVGRIARPFMQELADQCQAAVSLGARHDLTMIYVAHCRSRARLTLGLDVGARLPLSSTAMGRSVLFAMSPPEQARLRAQTQASNPGAWPDVSRRLDKAAAQYARLGFVTSESEWESDISAVGVPVDLGDGRSLFGLTVGGTSTHLHTRYLHDEVGPLLVQTAKRIVDVIRTAGWRD